MTSFRFLRKLGEGTFAEVWEVEEEVSGNRAALKILKKKFQNVGEVYQDAEFKALQAFSNGSSRCGNAVVDGATISCPELLMLSGCSSILHDRRHNLWEPEASFHPRLTGIYDVFHDPRQGRVVFMLELLGHSLLDEILERKAKATKRRRQQMFYERELRTVLYQILDGINELHSRGIFHRDIKPENILFRKNNINQIKLADFGSCQFVNKEDRKIIESAAPTLRGKENRKTSEAAYTEYIATRWYRSPECLLTAGHYGPPMDLWAAGCVAIELLTGLPFFPGENEIDQLSLIHKMFGKEFGNPTVRFSIRDSQSQRYRKVHRSGWEPFVNFSDVSVEGQQ